MEALLAGAVQSGRLLLPLKEQGQQTGLATRRGPSDGAASIGLPAEGLGGSRCHLAPLTGMGDPHGPPLPSVVD